MTLQKALLSSLVFLLQVKLTFLTHVIHVLTCVFFLFILSSWGNNFLLLPHLYGSLSPFLVLCTLWSHVYTRLPALTDIVTTGTHIHYKGNAKKSSAWWSQH